jgi:spermidine synthase
MTEASQVQVTTGAAPPREVHAGGTLIVPTLLFGFYLLGVAGGGILMVLGFRLFSLTAGWTASASLAGVAAVALAGAIGSLTASLRSDRSASPAGRLAVLLAAFGLSCLAAVGLFLGARAVYLFLWPLLGGTEVGAWGLRFGLGLALLSLPAGLLFALPPFLLRLLAAGWEKNGTALGFAFGLSLAGLGVGVATGGMVILPDLGLRGGFLVALGLTGCAAAGVALLRQAGLEGAGALGRRLADGAAAEWQGTASPGCETEGVAMGGTIVAAILGIGFSGWAFLIAWMRTLVFIIGGSVTANAVVGAVFLIGLALGALLASGLADRTRSPCLGLTILVSSASVVAYGSMFLAPSTTALYLKLSPWLASPFLWFLPATVSAASLMLPACLLLGAALPFLSLMAAVRFRPLTGTLGLLAVGAVLAELTVGLMVLPAFGLRRTVALAAAVGLLAAILFIGAVGFRRPGTRRTVALSLLGLMVVLGGFPASWDPRVVASGVYRYGATALAQLGSAGSYLAQRRAQGLDVIFYREGRNSSAMVEMSQRAAPGQAPEEVLRLTVDGAYDAGTGDDVRAQVLQGQIPLLVHGPAEKVLLIGLLDGVSAGSILRHPVKSLTVIEREPVLYAAAETFSAYNTNPQNDDRLVRIDDDARARLLADQALYDVVILSTMQPWLPYNAALYTAEGYDLIKSRLRPGGLVAQRVPLGAVAGPALRAVLRTFEAAFPSVLLFQISSQDLLLLGSAEPLALDVGWLRNVISSSGGVADDLRRVLVLGPNEILLTFRLGAEPLRRLAGEGPLNGDALAPVEMIAAHDPSVRDNGALLQEIDGAWAGIMPFLKNYGALPQERAEFLYNLAKSYLGIAGDPMRAHDLSRELSGLGQTAMARWVEGEALLQDKNIDGALEEWRAVLDLDPTNLDALFSLGTYYLDARDYWKAEPYLERAARAAPGVADVQYQHGRTLFYLGRYRDAIAALQRARTAGGERNHYPLVDYLVGVSYEKLGETGPAADALKTYLKWAYEQSILTRLEVDAHLKLADVYDKQGKRFDAHTERQKGEELRRKIEAYAKSQQR